MFAKFRIAKTRIEWKKELEKCKYITGTSTLPMINKFQLYCGKLQWPLPVQIEKIVRILPMQLRQFVVSRAHANFAGVTESVKTFQELIEVDTLSHDNNYRDKQYNPSYFDRRYNNSNGFSPARNYNQDRYQNQNQNRPFQNRYQGGNYRNRPNNNNNNGYDWNQGFQHIRKGQLHNQQQFNRNNQARQNYSDHPASFNRNDRYMGHSNYNSISSLSDVLSFVTRDGVTFDARRNLCFPNDCTVK